MARKKDSKAIWIGGSIHAAFRKKLEAEGWTWGLTKKVESILLAYAEGKISRAGSAPSGGRNITSSVEGPESPDLLDSEADTAAEDHTSGRKKTRLKN